MTREFAQGMRWSMPYGLVVRAGSAAGTCQATSPRRIRRGMRTERMECPSAILLAARSIDAVVLDLQEPHVIDVVFARRPERVEHDADEFHLRRHRGGAERLGPAGIGLPLAGAARRELALPDVLVNERLEVPLLLDRLARHEFLQDVLESAIVRAERGARLVL